MGRLIALKLAMIDKDVTSHKVSQDLGINSSMFSMYLNGWRKVPHERKILIAEYFGIEQEKLFEGEK